MARKIDLAAAPVAEGTLYPAPYPDIDRLAPAGQGGYQPAGGTPYPDRPRAT